MMRFNCRMMFENVRTEYTRKVCLFSDQKNNLKVRFLHGWGNADLDSP